MTSTTAIIVNVLGAIGLVGALALVVRTAHRIPHKPQAETLHPSQPLDLVLLTADERSELAA